MSLFGRFSALSRQRKAQMFLEWMQVTPATRVLDVGGEADGSLQLLDFYPYPHRVSLINLDPEHVARVRARYPMVDARVGDARALPWPDRYFDGVYSNAVIEHVGDYESQRRMAAEIMRVGKRWFVTTPNRWFPFEFHTRLPLAGMLPRPLFRALAYLLHYNHVQRRYVHGPSSDAASLHLLAAAQLAELFAGGTVVKQRVTVWPETLIAIGGARLAAAPLPASEAAPAA